METKNRLNEYSQSILTTEQAVQLLLNGKSVEGVCIEDDAERDIYNSSAEEVLHHPSSLSKPGYSGTVEQFHEENANTWHIDEKYKTIDVLEFVLERCSNDTERERVCVEYMMYEERGLIDVLRALIFLVDHFRENGTVWGVGRGSSVSSYILYKIGIHKIDSIKYDLPIEEFLK
jgi:DNA polymerase III alpha subunit